MKDAKITDIECMALVDAAYAEFQAVLAGPHTSDDHQAAWDTLIEKRDEAFSRLQAKFRKHYGM